MQHSMPETGVRKAAILVASLDQAAADLLLDRLPAACADRVRQMVMDIDRIDPEERRRVLDDFRRIGPMVPDRSPAGIDLMNPPTEIRLPEADESSEATTVGDESSAAPFGFLLQAEVEKLARLLESERSQTIALVLSHLPPEQAGNVLARFVPALQIEVVRRLVGLQNADPDTLREIEQTLESRMLRQIEDRPGERSTGPDAVAKILSACPGKVVGNILDHLAEQDESLARRLGRRTIEFDELARFDDATLLAVVHEADPQVLEAALLGSPPLLVDRILCLMRPDEARIFRRRLDQPGPIRLSDLEDARRRIATLAQHLQYGSRPRRALAA